MKNTLASPTTARFMGLELEVLPDVLVPREETELLCRASFDILRARPAPQIVIDMCCGAGNLACAVACEFPDAIIFGSDLTDNCVGAARRNVERLGLVGRVQVFQGDLFEGLRRADLAGRADLVICTRPTYRRRASLARRRTSWKPNRGRRSTAGHTGSRSTRGSSRRRRAISSRTAGSRWNSARASTGRSQPC